eukprot:CAMPEP_0116923052 /NCGR_PEP_ID=MMETSP0467-20121206/22637_1 /TAXON_ID=283647 /ORGANISM="Mesodinium pulex, Strain SPMC105" /LENGTH=110 /DNA_ID=CAMNT_0004601519 /DNA_START=481 /DNA_END=810 /DNA_ORIENTATION=+
MAYNVAKRQKDKNKLAELHNPNYAFVNGAIAGRGAQVFTVSGNSAPAPSNSNGGDIIAQGNATSLSFSFIEKTWNSVKKAGQDIKSMFYQPKSELEIPQYSSGSINGKGW